MKINALEIDGYGVWSGLKLEGLSDGLNVFFGPNEAGKTTLLQFVRSVLYGFSEERRRYLPPLGGGRPGGWLVLAGTGGRFRVGRYADEICYLSSPAPLPQEQKGVSDRSQGERGVSEGTLTILAADGTRHDQRALEKLLGGIDERIFNHVFAVGLEELQELGALGDTQAAAMLYNLSAGLDRVPLVEVIRALEASRNHILSREGGPCEVGRLLAERDKLRAEIDELGALTRTWGRLAAERERMERETARLEEEHRQAEHQARAAEIALRLGRRWQDRKLLDEELAALGPVEPVPDGAVERLDALHSRLEDRQKRMAAWKRRWEAIRAEAKGLEINEALWRLAPRIEALQEQEGWIGTLEKRAGELETEIAQLEAQLAAERRQLGLGDGDGKTLPEISPRSLASLRRPARSVRRCRRELEEARQQVAAASRAADALSGEVEAALSARGQTNLGDAMDRLGALVAQLRRRAQIDERIQQMESYQAELAEQGRALVDRQVLPVWAVAGLGVMFVAGAAMVVFSALGWLAWMVAVVGMGGVLGSVGAKFVFERSSARRLAGCQKQLAMLQAQVRQAREERDALDRQLPPGDGPLEARLKAAEKELAALEEVVPLDSRRQAASREIEAAKARAAEAEQALVAAQKRWKEAVAALGLPASFSPRQVRVLAERCDEIGEIRRRLDLRYEEFQQRNRELEGVTGRIARLAAEAGLAMPGQHPAEQLRRLTEELAEQEGRRKRRGELRAEARRLRRRRARLEASLRKLRQRRRELLESAGAKDEADVRRRAELAGRVQSLCAQREAVQREIDAAIAGFCPEETIRQILQTPASGPLEARCDELRRRAQETQQRLQEQFERRGRLREQIRALAADRALAVKQLELNIVEKRLEEAVHRWRVQAVACRILGEVRATYERQRQPETLREASVHLERLTQGRYRRVWTPLDEDVLRLDSAEGKSLAVEMLSRGSREQLFLSLRLALARCFARRGAALPLLLDDVLVNFDMDRAKAAAAVLRDFAGEGQQLFVFTCHEHIAKLFRALKVEVRDLPSHGRVEAAAPEPLRPAAQRKRRKKVDEPPALPVARPEEAPEAAPEPEPESEPEIVRGEEEPESLDELVELPLEELWPEDEIEGSDALLAEADDEVEGGEDEEDLAGEEADDRDEENQPEEEGPEEEEEGGDEDEGDEDDDLAAFSRRARRIKDDWDDAYEDEYDEEEEDREEFDQQEEDDEDAKDGQYGDGDQQDGAEAA